MSQIWAEWGRRLTSVPIMFVFRCSLRAASVGHVVVYICVGRAEAAEILTRPLHVSLGGNYREMAPLSDTQPFIWGENDWIMSR